MCAASPTLRRCSTSPRNCARALDGHFTVRRPEIVEEQVSNDGTRKWLFRFPPRGAGRPVEIETVYIPEEGRGTLCVSSQVGCTLTCSFCHTGTQKLVRNLTAEEILTQLMTARDRLGDFPDRDTPDGAIVPAEGRKITNVVMMGMGEPLYNFEEVKKALLIASDGDGLSLSKRRITLSTSGVVPEIHRAGAEIGVMLAISLHAVRDDLRDMLVPINKKYPLKELIEACRNYPGLSNARRITFEYVMLRDVNDSLADARELVRLLKGIPAKINLIPFNPWPGTNYQCSDWETIERFADSINSAGYASPIRTPRGRDILAACGQLKSEFGADAKGGPAGARGDDDRGARRGVAGLARVLVYLGRFALILFAYAVASLAASTFLHVISLGSLGFTADEAPAVVMGSIVFSIPFVALFVAYFAFLPSVPRSCLPRSSASATGSTMQFRVRSWRSSSSRSSAARRTAATLPSPIRALRSRWSAAACAAGIAYWLVAGRLAGNWREKLHSSRDGRGRAPIGRPVPIARCRPLPGPCPLRPRPGPAARTARPSTPNASVRARR